MDVLIGSTALVARGLFESFAAIARVCSVTREAARKWERIPPEHCRAIEAATGGKVTVHDLRPDIFGPPPSAPATPPAEQAA
jgi:DNA-binding transcriptional regulator YdaS (Cro superfamily)